MSKSRGVIVFVHGFGSSRTCWDTLVSLLQSDRDITERFDFDFFEYPTDWVNLKPTERIPGHKELAQKFRAFVASERFVNREITLVGHSQGGLVIHAYLNFMVEESWGEQLELIRQVITFATPHYGSNLFSGLRRLFSRFIDNPQERRLRTLDEDLSDVVRNVNTRIATTHQADGAHWPIPVIALVASLTMSYQRPPHSNRVESQVTGPFPRLLAPAMENRLPGDNIHAFWH